MILDPLYFILIIPAVIVGFICSGMVKSTFNQYARIGVNSGLTGAEAARLMLERKGIYNVTIEPVHGFLSDHYDPQARALRLSPDVYQGRSISAIGVACHEAGHAIQHAEGYKWLEFRSKMVPVQMICSQAWSWIIMASFFMGFNPQMILAGVVVFGVATLFSLITLPVEYDASARAKRAMASAGLLTAGENEGAAKVLNAAFLTYVAGVLSSVMTLLYFLIRSGLLGGRSDD